MGYTLSHKTFLFVNRLLLCNSNCYGWSCLYIDWAPLGKKLSVKKNSGVLTIHVMEYFSTVAMEMQYRDFGQCPLYGECLQFGGSH